MELRQSLHTRGDNSSQVYMARPRHGGPQEILSSMQATSLRGGPIGLANFRLAAYETADVNPTEEPYA